MPTTGPTGCVRVRRFLPLPRFDCAPRATVLSAVVRESPDNMTRFFLPLLVVAVLSASCSTDPSASDGTASDTTLQALQALRNEKSDWLDRRQELETTLAEHEKQVQATTRLIHKILDDLSALADRKDLVRSVGVNPPAQLAADFPETEQAVRAAETSFTRHLSLIESNLADSQEQIDRVRNGERIEPETVAQLTATISELRTQVEQQDSTQAVLETTTDSLQQSLAVRNRLLHQIQRKTDSLQQQLRAERRAFIAIGTADALEQRGIIDQRFLRSPELEPLRAERFDTLSVTATRIPLPEAADEVQILSLHRNAPELYTIERGGLLIRDPAAFWDRSKFLIVEIGP